MFGPRSCLCPVSSSSGPVHACLSHGVDAQRHASEGPDHSHMSSTLQEHNVQDNQQIGFSVWLYF